MDLLKRAHQIADDLVAMRRDLHRHPELSFQEVRTAAVAADAVEKVGFEVRRQVGKTGVVADLDNGDGPTIALRADMDALPILEANTHDFVSETPGTMHACGHDAHTTGLVGAARLLVQARDEGHLPSGKVRLLFQPSEEAADAEGKSGATRMMEDGAMEGVDAVVGLHVGAMLPAGKFFLAPGVTMAGTEDLRVEVRGRSAHAALPHEGVDAILLAAQGLVAVQQAVSRGLSPMESGVVTFGRISGGTAANIIAGSAHLQGTLRYFDQDVRERLSSIVRGSFKMLESLGAEVDVQIGPGYPPLSNDSALVERVREALIHVAGEDAVFPATPIMGGEDFAFLARAVPGCFFWLGAALPDTRQHHHPCFDIDESVLPLGAASLAQAAIHLMSAEY